MVEVIAIGIGFALIGIGILGMLYSGVKNVMRGKSDLKKFISFVVPAAVFGVAYAVTGTFGDAGIATMIFMMVVMGLLIVFTGARSTFKF